VFAVILHGNIFGGSCQVSVNVPLTPPCPTVLTCIVSIHVVSMQISNRTAGVAATSYVQVHSDQAQSARAQRQALTAGRPRGSNSNTVTATTHAIATFDRDYNYYNCARHDCCECMPYALLAQLPLLVILLDRAVHYSTTSTQVNIYTFANICTHMYTTTLGVPSTSNTAA
jgi:hypothetical protein